MATLKQTLNAKGFFYNNDKRGEQYWLKRDGRFIGNSYVSLDICWGQRNARSVTVVIRGKRKRIHFDYSLTSYGWSKPTEKQMARFEELLEECFQAAKDEYLNPPPVAPRKKAPPRPALTDEQKAENKVWRWLGYFTAQGMISKEQRDKDTGGGLYYYRKGKYIRVEDNWRCMAYANIRQVDLDESKLGFTLDTFEEWLLAHGVEKRREKRMKYTPPLYD